MYIIPLLYTIKNHIIYYIIHSRKREIEEIYTIYYHVGFDVKIRSWSIKYIPLCRQIAQ